MTPFTHLHVHTQYSLLDGAARINELVARAKAQGQTALAITDHGVMYGVIDFYKACKKEGVKPILGMEAYVAPRSMRDRQGAQDREYAHLVLLAKNQTGYQNLMLLSSEAFVHGFYYKPRIDYDLLAEHAEGLVCLSACLAGDIPQALLHGRYDEAKRLGERLQAMFGDDFYIELQNHGLAEQQRILPDLRRLAGELGVKTVATNDVHYVEKADAEAQDVLLCIQTQRFVDEPNRMRMEAEEFYLKSGDEMAAALPEDAEALAATIEIADKCDVEIAFGVRRLPHYTAPDGLDNETYLRQLCAAGMQKKLGGGDTAAHERLEYELGVIARMGFVDYFLIVWDFIHFAKTHGIVVGPGRGSGAGSLVAYCMDITDVNPLRYGLLFERFLNPERVSMPDFDVDFCYERRGEVIDYVIHKYGADHVAQIVTFGTMAARAVIRDVGRVLDMPYQQVDAVAKLVPMELKMTLQKALKASKELARQYEQDPSVHELIDMALKLEGMPRHASTHAAGVVITREAADEYVPLSTNDGNIVTQFPMTTIEELGLLKMDFLGLRTLTVIHDAEQMVRKTEPGFSVAGISYEDAAVFEMLNAGETEGVFQMESGGMTQTAVNLQLESLEDIIAIISLYRPGPMDSIPTYIANRHNPQNIRYKTPQLAHILDVTNGCIVYQEQVIKIFQELAGYSLGQADMVRRAMSKKKAKDVEREREAFLHGDESRNIRGCVANGIPEKTAQAIYDEIYDFANYAFNKAHAVSYAVVAYQTAYFKCHYTKEYMAALLTSVLDNSDKVSEYIAECRNCDIKLLPPDVNRSHDGFTVEEDGIRFGLVAIKNIGRGFIRTLVREREANGLFRSFPDFCERMFDCGDMNKRAVENLIKAGAFDGLGAYRSQLVQVYEKVLDAIANSRKVNVEGQLDMFSMTGGSSGSAGSPMSSTIVFNRTLCARVGGV